MNDVSRRQGRFSLSSPGEPGTWTTQGPRERPLFSGRYGALTQLNDGDPPRVSATRDAMEGEGFDLLSMRVLGRAYHHSRSIAQLCEELAVDRTSAERAVSVLVSRGLMKRVARHARWDRDFCLSWQGVLAAPGILAVLRVIRPTNEHPPHAATVSDGVCVCTDCSEIVAQEVPVPLRVWTEPARRR